MINIAEILKNAPKGLKLYSLIHGDVTLESVDTAQEYYPIDIIANQSDCTETLSKDGKIYHEYEDGVCILFPSKEHRTWNNWQEVLFQIGDVVTNEQSINPETFIYLGYDEEINEYFGSNNKGCNKCLTLQYYRYATSEEREQFMAELNANGYKWNADTKQIEKIEQQNTPKYKVGDWIKRLTPNNKEKKYFLLKVTGINDVSYQLENIYGNRYYKEKTFVEDEKYWELATEQELIDDGIKERPFTIDSFKTFDKVLCRCKGEYWGIEFFERYDDGKYYCLSCRADYCIPYNDETKHLIGTDDDCPDKYKTW